MSTVNNEGNLIFDFVEENGQRAYVAEFKATGPFSLHIERRESGRITVYQKSYENGKYATVKNVDIAPQDTIIDAEVPGGVFPKWIKIKSSSAVEVAEVTFEGEQSGGGAGEIVYVKSENLPQGAAPMLLSLFSVISAVKNNGTIYIMPPATATNMFPDAEVVGVGYMPDMEVVLSNGRATIAETFAESGVTEDVLAPAIITKEQFYSLEA